MMKKALTIFGNIIFAAAVLYLCYYIMMAVQDRAPDLFGYRMLRVMSDSMKPVFGSGDCIIVKKVGQEEIKVGDIITFLSADPVLDGHYNTHRVIDIAEDRITAEKVYFTKGDSNIQADDYAVSYEDIAGKYVCKLPYGIVVSGFLQKLTDSNYYFVIVILPILLCLLSCVCQLVREIKRKR